MREAHDDIEKACFMLRLKYADVFRLKKGDFKKVLLRALVLEAREAGFRHPKSQLEDESVKRRQARVYKILPW